MRTYAEIITLVLLLVFNVIGAVGFDQESHREVNLESAECFVRDN